MSKITTEEIAKIAEKWDNEKATNNEKILFRSLTLLLKEINSKNNNTQDPKEAIAMMKSLGFSQKEIKSLLLSQINKK